MKDMWLCAAAGPRDRETLCDIVKVAVNIDVFHCISRMCAEPKRIYIYILHDMSQRKRKKTIKSGAISKSGLKYASTINTFQATKCSVTPGP